MADDIDVIDLVLSDLPVRLVLPLPAMASVYPEAGALVTLMLILPLSAKVPSAVGATVIEGLPEIETVMESAAKTEVLKKKQEIMKKMKLIPKNSIYFLKLPNTDSLIMTIIYLPSIINNTYT